MLKVYKSDSVEVSEKSFHVENQTIELRDYILSAKENSENASDDGTSTLEPMLTSDEVVALLKKAQERADQIIQEAQEKAEQNAEVVLQRAREQARVEAEDLRKRTYDDAYNNGTADGIKAKTRQVESVITKLEETVVRIEGEMSGFIAQYEGDLKWGVMEVASKVLDKIIDRDDMEMLEMVKAAVDTVKNSQWIEVHLSDEAVYLIDRLEREMAPMQYLTIVPEELPKGSCIVDVPTGRIDASIQTQLDNLKEYFAAHSGDI
ncbi:MAG: FliH/SctL family protein [Angelakisella sp.]